MATLTDAVALTVLGGPVRGFAKYRSHSSLAWKRAAFVSVSRGPMSLYRYRGMNHSDVVVARRLRLRTPVVRSSFFRRPTRPQQQQQQQPGRVDLKQLFFSRNEVSGRPTSTSASTSFPGPVRQPYFHIGNLIPPNLDSATSALLLGASALVSGKLGQVSEAVHGLTNLDSLFDHTSHIQHANLISVLEGQLAPKHLEEAPSTREGDNGGDDVQSSVATLPKIVRGQSVRSSLSSSPDIHSTTHTLMQLCEENRRLQRDREVARAEIQSMNEQLSSLSASLAHKTPQMAAAAVAAAATASISITTSSSSNATTDTASTVNSTAMSPATSTDTNTAMAAHVKLSSLLHGLARSREEAESHARSLQGRLASAFASAVEQHNSATAGLQAGWAQLTAWDGAHTKHRAEEGVRVKQSAAGVVVSQEVAAAADAAASSVSSTAHSPASPADSSTAAAEGASGFDSKANSFSASLSPVATRLSQFKSDARTAATQLSSLDERLDVVSSVLMDARQAGMRRGEANNEVAARVQALLSRKRPAADADMSSSFLPPSVQIASASRDGAGKVADTTSPAFSQLQKQLSNLRILHEQEGEREGGLKRCSDSVPWVGIAPVPARPAAAAASLSAVRSPAVHKLLMELSIAKANHARYEEAVEWTHAKLLSLTACTAAGTTSEASYDVTSLQASLEFAERRAKEEGERVSSLERQVREVTGGVTKGDTKSRTLLEEIAELKQQLSQLSSRASDTSSNLLSAQVAADTALVGQQQQRQQQAAERGGPFGLVVTALSAAGATAASLSAASSSAVSKKSSSPARRTSGSSSMSSNVSSGNHVGRSAALSSAAARKAKRGKALVAARLKDGRVRTVSLTALKQYGRAVWSAYVDPSLPLHEQRVGASLLVEELVAMGGSLEWAQQFVSEGLQATISTGSSSSDSHWFARKGNNSGNLSPRHPASV